MLDLRRAGAQRICVRTTVRLLSSILLLALPTAAHADADPWFGRDKALHFGASATLAAGGYALGGALFDGREARLATGAGLALGAGVAKELADLAGAGDPSWRDMAWNAIGTGAGLLLAWGADSLFFAQKRTEQGAAAAHFVGIHGRF